MFDPTMFQNVPNEALCDVLYAGPAFDPFDLAWDGNDLSSLVALETVTKRELCLVVPNVSLRASDPECSQSVEWYGNVPFEDFGAHEQFVLYMS